ncbi:MAG: DUF2723 domain-containing protein [Spirochaetales bacterium]|nr:DUF2723 domain-containing protein [Spirochaetales bacterium]
MKHVRFLPALLPPLGVFLGSFLLYRLTAARFVGWVDAAWILTSAKNLELGVWANVHNLFNLLGFLWLKVFSGVDPHLALTALCSLFGSLTVLGMYLAGMELTGNKTATLLGSAALAVSLSLWWHSTAIEVYTLNTALISLMFYAVLRAFRRRQPGFLCLAFFAGGLGISNHVLMGLYIIAFFFVLLPLAFRRFHLKVRYLAAFFLCYLAGAAFYAVLFFLQWLHFHTTGNQSGVGGLFHSFVQTFQYAMGGPFLQSMFTTTMGASQKFFWRWNYLFLIGLNYPSPALLFIFRGFPLLWSKKDLRPVVLFYLVGLAAQVIWSANYFIWDMYAFALPVYVMLFLPLTAGLDRFLSKRRRGALGPILLLSFLIPVVLYPCFSRWPNRENTVDRYMALYPEAERTGGIWDPAEYIFNPIKRTYRGAEIFCEGVLAVLPHGAEYWDDESKGAYPLEYYYQDILGKRRDVHINRIFGLIMNDEDADSHARRILSQLRQRKPVFLAALVEPQREILNRLYTLLDREASLEEVRVMDLAAFRKSFPVYEFIDVPLPTNDSLRIYRLKKRP